MASDVGLIVISCCFSSWFVGPVVPMYRTISACGRSGVLALSHMLSPVQAHSVALHCNHVSARASLHPAAAYP